MISATATVSTLVTVLRQSNKPISAENSGFKCSLPWLFSNDSINALKQKNSFQLFEIKSINKSLQFLYYKYKHQHHDEQKYQNHNQYHKHFPQYNQLYIPKKFI
jgi:hypothetical protein